MRFETFLTRLAKVLDFHELKPDSQGSCTLIKTAENISLLFEWDDELVPNTVLISSQLMPFPLQYRQDIYFSCLKANSSLEETISVKPDEDLIYMHRRVHPDIEDPLLKVTMDNFIHHFLHYRKHFETLLAKPPTVHAKDKDSSSSIRLFPYKA